MQEVLSISSLELTVCERNYFWCLYVLVGNLRLWKVVRYKDSRL